MSFGHTGIDWLHSLLDSNKDIFIMTEFSFYRTWKMLNFDIVNNYLDMANMWTMYLSSDEMQSSYDTRKFSNQKEVLLFNKHLSEYLKKNGVGKKTVLWGIHEAYYLAKDCANTYKVVVVHEHVSFYFDEIISDFERPKVLMIIRDPRASLAGYYKGISKKYPKHADSYSYFHRMATEDWVYAVRSYYKYKDKLGCDLYIIKNESMVDCLEAEMKSLALWIGVTFRKDFLSSTTPNRKKWTPDSCYLSKGEDVVSLSDYYLPENVEKRWRNVLSSKKEIMMIEQIFWNIMQDFQYVSDSKNNIYNKLLSIMLFIVPARSPIRFKVILPSDSELKRVGMRLSVINKKLLPYWTVLPKYLKYIFIYASNALSNACILMSIRSSSRYNNKNIDDLYRGAK